LHGLGDSPSLCSSRQVPTYFADPYHVRATTDHVVPVAIGLFSHKEGIESA
jgi:hypothetical protein